MINPRSVGTPLRLRSSGGQAVFPDISSPVSTEKHQSYVTPTKLTSSSNVARPVLVVPCLLCCIIATMVFEATTLPFQFEQTDLKLKRFDDAPLVPSNLLQSLSSYRIPEKDEQLFALTEITTSSSTCHEHIIFTSFKCNAVPCMRHRALMEKNTADHHMSLNPAKVSFVAVPPAHTIRNRFGLPTLASLYNYTRSLCPNATTYTFINGDILLDAGFLPTVEAVIEWKKHNEPQMPEFLIVGPRIDVPWIYPALSAPYVEEHSTTPNSSRRIKHKHLRRKHQQEGKTQIYTYHWEPFWQNLTAARQGGYDLPLEYVCTATDYFIMSRDAMNLNTFPASEMVIGRPGFDMWIVDRAYRDPNVAVVNSRHTLTAVHQISPYTDSSSNSAWKMLDNKNSKDRTYNADLLYPEPKQRPVYGTTCQAAWWTHEQRAQSTAETASHEKKSIFYDKNDTMPAISVSLHLPAGEVPGVEIRKASWERKHRINIALRLFIFFTVSNLVDFELRQRAHRELLDALVASGRHGAFRRDRVDVMIVFKPPSSVSFPNSTPSSPQQLSSMIAGASVAQSHVEQWAEQYCRSGAWEFGECGVLRSYDSDYLFSIKNVSRARRPNTTNPFNHYNDFMPDKTQRQLFLKEDIEAHELPADWYHWLFRVLDSESAAEKLKEDVKRNKSVSIILHNMPVKSLNKSVLRVIDGGTIAPLLQDTPGFFGFLPDPFSWYFGGSIYMLHKRVRLPNTTIMIHRIGVVQQKNGSALQQVTQVWQQSA